ncbi:hypothetical protein O0L34_g13499 [Tuta absoluta]|nr:hypothetical protein O0L34_g13499 [Tuta absoluta]
MICAKCGKPMSDGPQCAGCKGHFDFTCANIREAAYKGLKSAQKAAWKCPICKPAGSPSDAAKTGDPVTLEDVLKEVKNLKLQLRGVPTLVEDVKTLKNDLAALKSSYEFDSAKLDEFHNRISKLEDKIPEIEQLTVKVDTSMKIVAE